MQPLSAGSQYVIFSRGKITLFIGKFTPFIGKITLLVGKITPFIAISNIKSNGSRCTISVQ